MLNRHTIASAARKLWTTSTSTSTSNFPEISRMTAWATSSSDASVKRVKIPFPIILRPNQLLLQTKATSVNPIDTEMINNHLFETFFSYFPIDDGVSIQSPKSHLICGRDCSGIVHQVGGGVKRFKKNDQVMAVIGLTQRFGSHAEYVIAEEEYCAMKPDNVSHAEAACLPYVACTAWSALVKFGGINSKNAAGQKILIHGGAGGVGTTAIQMLKAWNVAKVVATCSEDSFELVSSLGAIPVYYNDPRVFKQLIDAGPYDLILDCVDSKLSRWSDEVLGLWRNCKHVSVVSPLLENARKYGIVAGTARSAINYFDRAISTNFIQGQWYCWAFFQPNSECIQEISTLLAAEKIKAVIDQKFNFDEIPLAYAKVAKKKGRGKTVIEL